MKIEIFTTLLFLLNYTCASKKDASVIIIGAGAAGVAAGKRLLENGLENVKILEAESRIGGRIHSVFFGDNYVDLGATFCYGEEGNVVYSTVKNLDLLSPTDIPKKFYQSSGEDVDTKFGDELFDALLGIYEGDIPPVNISFGEYLREKCNKVINEMFGSDEKKLKLAQDALDSFEVAIMSNEAVTNLNDLAANSDFEENEGNLELNWKGKGFKTFLEVYLGKYPDNSKISEVEKKVILNKEVQKIEWNVDKNHEGVTIHTSDNSKYLADHVIVTPSLGVLKKDAGSLFHPGLPAEKQRAIDKIGFGVIMEVVLHYPTKWWDDNFTGFNVIWNRENRDTVSLEFPDGPKHHNRSWVTYTSGFLVADGNPNVLKCWFAGVLVPEMELLPDETLSNGITYILKKFSGHTYNITKPDKILHSTWNKNPHFRGSYSHQTLEAVKGQNSINAEEVLAQPIKNDFAMPFVHFAGEATHPHHYSTVQGAVESGIREADMIIDFHKKNDE